MELTELKEMLSQASTEDECIAIVQKNGRALQFVKNQTLRICVAAVTVTPVALQYCDKGLIFQVLDCCYNM